MGLDASGRPLQSQSESADKRCVRKRHNAEAPRRFASEFAVSVALVSYCFLSTSWVVACLLEEKLRDDGLASRPQREVQIVLIIGDTGSSVSMLGRDKGFRASPACHSGRAST